MFLKHMLNSLLTIINIGNDVRETDFQDLRVDLISSRIKNTRAL